MASGFLNVRFESLCLGILSGESSWSALDKEFTLLTALMDLKVWKLIHMKHILLLQKQPLNREEEPEPSLFSDSVVDLRGTNATEAGSSGVFHAFVTVQIARRHENITKTQKQQK
ncbi:hypothetical protein HGM15179_003312 [Zosterops borbonicus]|uniref:Uncharacterized protein n=1 Tax=Zosterops borbonicus TaxID=364589 RepID=A0A8K1GS81_9PASS|nr:hypothetical protein HGM15179_003312 [Zosterops borbonicus]